MASRATVTKSTKKSRSKKKTNLLKLYTIMSKLAIDAVDKEIVRRFKILINAADEDISKSELDMILKRSDNFDYSSFHEGFKSYIHHYLFMMKRKGK